MVSITRSHLFRAAYACLLWLFLVSHAQADIVIATNSVWRLFRGTNEASQPAGTEWRTNTFDDSAWETGQAPFYFGFTPASGTLLSDMQSNYTCVMLRSSFFISNAAQVIALSNRPFADDGFIMWLNGIVVRQFNILGTSSNVFTPYTNTANVAALSVAWSSLNIYTNLIRTGTNQFAVQVFNRAKDDIDFFANPEIAVVLADITPPAVQSLNPPQGGYATNFAQLAVTFSESVTNVKVSDLRVNGAPPTSLTSNSAASYTFNFPLPAPGLVQVTWNPAEAIKDLSGNVFNATNTVWVFTNVVEAPRVISATPAFGATVSALTQVTVEFNRAVTGIAVEDFLVNGQGATTLTGSNTTYTFTFPAPQGTNIQITWDANHLIVDSTGIRMIEAGDI